MRIVHASNHSLRKYGLTYYSVDRKFSLALQRNGHFVYDFSDRDVARMESVFKSKNLGRKKLNRVLLETIDNIQPDLLLLGHTERFDENCLREARFKFPEMKIAQWYVDAVWTNEFKTFITNRLPFVDAFFMTSSPESIPYIENIEKSKLFFIPNPSDITIESDKAFENELFDYDVIYCGRDDPASSRGEFLRAFQDKLKSNAINGRFWGCLGNPPISGRSYYNELSKAKMGLNLSRGINSYKLYSSDRIAQLMGEGLLVFNEENSYLKKLYPDDSIVYYKDLNDIVEKILFYLSNWHEGKLIAQRGYNLAHTDFSADVIARYIVEVTLGTKFSMPYKWETIDTLKNLRVS